MILVRPMRDEMGIAGGVQHLQWLFSGTFVAMLAAVPLFGWLTRHFAPSRFLPYVYYFFIGNLLLFFILFHLDFSHAYVARAFFIWASVFNLFIVSVFWSFMADIFNDRQAKRLFGVIAAGGTAGTLTKVHHMQDNMAAGCGRLPDRALRQRMIAYSG
ncbi:MAG: hypothetical protein KFF50_07480 [Desulfatitalea sp.]|nr:hypothetical protein [Desulfatitalea sp.]